MGEMADWINDQLYDPRSLTGRLIIYLIPKTTTDQRR